MLSSTTAKDRCEILHRGDVIDGTTVGLGHTTLLTAVLRRADEIVESRRNTEPKRRKLTSEVEHSSVVSNFRFVGRSSFSGSGCTRRTSSALIGAIPKPCLKDALSNLIEIRAGTRYAIPAEGADPFKLQEIVTITAHDNRAQNSTIMLQKSQ